MRDRFTWRVAVVRLLPTAIISLVLLASSEVASAQDAVFDLAEGPLDVAIFGRGGDSLTHGRGTEHPIVFGDLDGDGSRDLVLAASAARDTSGLLDDSGRVHVFFGPLAAGTVVDLGVDPAELTLIGTDRMRLGAGLAVGDFDGDGRDDLAVGAPEWGRSVFPSGYRGRVLVFFGPFVRGTVIDLASEEADWRLDTEELHAIGYPLAAGDLTGDGIDDLVLGLAGSAGPDGSRSGAGAVRVYFGPLARGDRLTTEDEPGDVVVHGRAPGSFSLGNPDHLGHALAVGDLTGDGLADLAMSALYAASADGAREDAGEVYVLFAPLVAGTVLDLALESPDAVVWGGRGAAMPADDDGDLLGEDLAIGDVSGDGVGDLVMGAGSHDGPRDERAHSAGLVHVLFGPLAPGTVVDAALPGAMDVTVLGAHAGDNLGDGSSLGVGDLDGDGADDLVMGAYRASGPDDARRWAGEVFATCGPLASGRLIDLATDSAGVRVIGAAEEDELGRGIAVADVSGDGLADVLMGAAGAMGLGGAPDDLGVGAGALHVFFGDPCDRPPTCDAGGPYVVDCATAMTCPLGFELTLDASGSRAGSAPIRDHEWFVGPGCLARFLEDGERVTDCFGPRCDRPCLLRLTVRDTEGRESECFTEIQLADDVPLRLEGVPPDAEVACDAVPVPETPTVSDDCPGSPPAVDLEETRLDGRCLDTYTLTRTWIATDRCGNVASDARVLDVSDVQPPRILGVPADAVVDCNAVPPPVSPDVEDGCDPEPMLAFSEERVPGDCPGEETIVRTWTATDRCGNEATESRALTVVDTTPPVVTPGTETLACLWSPRHDFACFDADEVAPVITDDCSEPVTWRFGPVTSDQAEDARGTGDGRTAPDVRLGPDGSSACVRAERDGTGREGRRYAVSVIATDACGNESAPVVVGFVHVAHDRREHQACRRGDGR